MLAISFCALSFNTEVAFAPTAHASFFVPMSVPVVTPPVIAKPADPLVSNCWLYVKSIYSDLPNTPDIYTNTTPHVGVVAFFKYGTLDHYAIITKLTVDGFWVKDSNFGGPGYRTHFIEWSNSHIRGFYNPAGNSE